MTLVYDWLKISAKARGSAKALVYRDNYLSWRGLLHRVDRRAAEFTSLGIKPKDWVGLMLGNVPDFVILALALAKIDAVVVPIDPTTGARELELMLTAAPVRGLVTRPRGSEGNVSASGAVNRDESEDPPEIRRRLQGTLLTCSVFSRESPNMKVSPVSVMFTSDSHGDPKGVLRTQENLVAITETQIKTLSIDTASRILVSVPLFHSYAWDIGLLPMLKTGATIFLEEEVSARRIAKVIREQKIDVVPGTPSMYAELSRLPTAKPITVDNPRFLSAGSHLEVSIAENFKEKYEVSILSSFFSTETGSISMDISGKAPKTVGKPLEGVEVRITNAKGVVTSGSREGILWIRSASLSPMAVNPYDQTKIAKKNNLVAIGSIDKDGWFRTGDKAKIDKSGRLLLLGREDNVVKVEGKRVALGEVEGCLESFPKVKQAKAVIIHDPLTTNAIVIARVVSKGNCKAEDLIDHCAKNLAPYKVPRRIEFCDQLK